VRRASHSFIGVLQDVCVSVCDLESSKRGGLGSIWDVAIQKNKTDFSIQPTVYTVKHCLPSSNAAARLTK
jgi:hypothetical protein